MIFQDRGDLLSLSAISTMRSNTTIADTFRGPLVSPNLANRENQNQNVHAIFNGPLFPIPSDQGTRYLIMPRVMDRPQVPGIADLTGFFGVYEIFPENTHSPHELSPLHIETIKGNEEKYHSNIPYNLEDIRVTGLPDGSYAAGLTAEEGGQPYPARFLIRPTPNGIQVISPMEIMAGLPPGKNLLMLDWDTAMYRRETDDDKIVVVRQNSQTSKWRIDKEIKFSPLKNTQGKTRVGLNGGERIPMATNGNFRLIIHVVDNIPQPNEDFHISTYHFRLAEFTLDAGGLPELVAVDPKVLLSYEDVVKVADPEGKIIPPDPHKKPIYNVGGAFHQKGNLKSLLYPVSLNDKLIELYNIPFESLQQPFE